MITSVQKFHKNMRKYFGIENPGDYMDTLYLQMKKAKIDLVKLDNFLGEYNGSMANHIKKKYGQPAMEFISSVI